MKEHLTTEQAWADFWGTAKIKGWIKSQPKWKQIPRMEKQYMYRAAKDAREGKLGYDRTKKILNKYASERYTCVEGFILKK